MRRAIVVGLVVSLLAAACAGGAGEPDQPGGGLVGLGVPGEAVYTLGPDLVAQLGGEVRDLLAAPDGITFLSPVLSPEGDRVAFVAFVEAVGLNAELSSDLRLLTIDGGERTLREPAEAAEFFWTPRWSPDGEAIVYARQRRSDDALGARFTVERVDLATNSVTELARGARDPHPSPDGRRLVVVGSPLRSSNLSLIDLTSGAVSVLLDEADGLNSFRLPQFSPNGDLIAVMASGDGPSVASAGAALRNGVQDVWVIRPDGSGLRRLTTVLEDQPDFSWSTDGRHLLLRGAFGTYTVDVEARLTITLGPGEFHGWHDWRGSLATEADADE